MKIKKEIPVKVAVVQMEPVVGETEKNLANCLAKVTEAADNGAQLIVLPELCVSGYVFANREEAFALSEPIPGGPSCQAFETLARERKIYLYAGLNENCGDRLYNTAVLFGPDGIVGKYRKLQIWDDEYLWFEPGDLGLPVFHTPIGRIGMLVCNDCWYQELYRILAMQGADIIIAGVDGPARPHAPFDMNTFVVFHAMAAANCSNVYVAVAVRTGIERNEEFAGRSVIVDNAGAIIAGPAGKTGEEILYADCDFARVRRHQGNLYNSVVTDRRVDVYDRLLGYDPSKYPQQ
ncbi:MAG: hydratase [Firmicutes bacterium]|nr:hydratase [Bacillota bacterium]MBQ6294283.1 hydratase [Bacillota bacterium]